MDKKYGTVPAETKKGGADMREMGMKITSKNPAGNSMVKEGAMAGSGLKGDMKAAASFLMKDTRGTKGIGNDECY